MRPRHEAASRWGNNQMYDVTGFGILYGWQVHWTAQLPVLLAVTAIMLLAGARARRTASIGVRHRRRLPIATARDEPFAPRRLRDVL